MRPRATNTCELYPNGNVACTQRPYALSPIQLTIFPLLAHDYFKPLMASPHATWPLKYSINAAIIPGANGFMGQPYVWNGVYEAKGEGPIKGAAPTILVFSNGKLSQQGGRYLAADDKLRIASIRASNFQSTSPTCAPTFHSEASITTTASNSSFSSTSVSRPA